ncbi:MAG TPA: tripartite tricarboxylate transporter permease, partial [Anaerolineae bacterium]
MSFKPDGSAIGLSFLSICPKTDHQARNILKRMSDAALVLCGLAGVMTGAIIAVIPGLHLYNLVGLAILVAARGQLPFPPEAFSMMMVGLVVGWSVINVLPAVFMFAPDDASAIFIQPATKLLLRG